MTSSRNRFAQALRHGFCACAAAAIVLVSIDLVEGSASGDVFAPISHFEPEWVRFAFLVVLAGLASGAAAGLARRDTDSPVSRAILAAVIPSTIVSAVLAYALYRPSGHAWSYEMAARLILTSRRFGLFALGSASVLGALIPLSSALRPGRDRRLAFAFVALTIATIVVCGFGVCFRFAGRFVDESVRSRFALLPIYAAIGLLFGLAIAVALLVRIMWIARGELRVAIACGLAGAMLVAPPFALVLSGRSARGLHGVSSFLVERRFEAISVSGRIEDPEYAPDLVLSEHEQYVVIESDNPMRPQRVASTDVERSFTALASERHHMREEVQSGRFLGGEEYMPDERLRSPDSIVLTLLIDRREHGSTLRHIVSAAIRARFERIDFVVVRGPQGAWQTPAFVRSFFPDLELARSELARVAAYTSDRSEGAAAPVVETLRVGHATDVTNLVRRIASQRPGVRPVLVVAD